MIHLIRITNPLDPTRDKITAEIEFLDESLAELIERQFDRDDDGDLSGLSYPQWAETITVSLNGRVLERTTWSETTPQDGDYIVVAPGVKGGSLTRTLGSIAVMVAAVAVGAVTFGAGFALAGLTATTTASLFAGVVSIAGNMLVSAFLGPSQPTNKSISASYDPDGPKSLAQSGVVIPKGYGTFRWGGNLITQFNEIAGQDEFINALFCHGFGPARSISSIQINGKDIASYQNVQYYTRLGTNDQTEIPQFNQISNGYPQNTQCLAGVPVIVPGTGDLTQALQVDVAFPNGCFIDTNNGNIIAAVITYQVQYRTAAVGTTPAGPWLSALLPRTTAPVIALHPNGTPYFPNKWGVIATDLAPNGNVVYHVDNGPHTPGERWTGNVTVTNYAPNGNHYDYQKQCTGEWQLLDINSNYVYVLDWTDGYVDFVCASTAPVYNRTQILGLAPGKYDVQITKYGSARIHDDVQPGDNPSPQIGQDLWVHSVNEITYLDLAYPNMILIGVRALATSQLSGANLTVTAVIEHGLRSRDEGLMPEELLAYEEDNPACIVADMKLDDLYGGGAWPGITKANLERYIDEWVAYAENNDTLVPDGNGGNIRLHVFNGVFDNESDLWTQAGVVTSMSRACIVPMGTDYGVAVDKAEDAPVQMFTVGNILQDSFTETFLDIDSRSNQVEVQFADATRYYKEDNPLVYMDQANMDSGTRPKPTRIRGKGIVIPAQAWHFARYKERGNQFLLRSGNFRTDTAGLACRPFNVVALQHDVPQWGIGGRTLPGTTATTVILDRPDAAFVAGTAFSLMIQHPSVQRFAGAVAAVATSTTPPGYTLTLSGWANETRVTRAIVNGRDCRILSSAAGSIVISTPPGFVPLANQAVTLFDTDVLETAPVTGVAVQGNEATLTLGTPLSLVPEEYSNYIYGRAGTVKWVRVTSIKKASEQRSTVEWIDYDDRIYDVGTPQIGETSAVITSNAGVTALTGVEILSQLPGTGAGGTYVGFASLSWQNGPDTVGVGIYAQIVGAKGLPQLVARVLNATTWQAQQASGSTITYTVVGFDKQNLYASHTAAPTVTIGAVGLTSNLLLDSNFTAAFNNWQTTPRAGDSLTAGASGEAIYKVNGSPLTGSLVIGTQTTDPSTWSVGQYLLLSGSVQAAGGGAGLAVLNLIFVNGSTGALTTTQATLALSAAGSLTQFQTAAALVPAGTSSVQIQFGLGGDNLNLPAGEVVTFAQLMVEVASAGQTQPSGYTPLNTQTLQGVGTVGRLTQEANPN